VTSAATKKLAASRSGARGRRRDGDIAPYLSTKCTDKVYDKVRGKSLDSGSTKPNVGYSPPCWTGHFPATRRASI